MKYKARVTITERYNGYIILDAENEEDLKKQLNYYARMKNEIPASDLKDHTGDTAEPYDFEFEWDGEYWEIN